MKTLLLALVVAAVAALAGWKYATVCAVGRAAPAAPTVVRAAAPVRPVTRVSAGESAPSPQSAAPDNAASPAETSLADALEVTTSRHATYAEKMMVWDTLRRAGQLDEMIVRLKRLALDHPNDAATATALGEAEVNQLRSVAEAGGNFNELGILAMQADQDFSAALTAEPGNWEAQYGKAANLATWPASLNKRDEVIQRLTSLATQQASQAPQPEFAQTYLLLGQQYQAAGKAGEALATWQQGLAQFPLNAALQQKLARAATP